MNKNNNSDSQWHMSKSISISTILSITIMFMGMVAAYAQAMGRFTAIETSVSSAIDDRIHRTTVIEMFKVRDVEISHLSEKIDYLGKEIEKTNGKIDKSNDILTKILIALPKAGSERRN